jgi:hypothetical protein
MQIDADRGDLESQADDQALQGISDGFSETACLGVEDPELAQAAGGIGAVAEFLGGGGGEGLLVVVVGLVVAPPLRRPPGQIARLVGSAVNSRVAHVSVSTRSR